jgi:hypothetical protein
MYGSPYEALLHARGEWIAVEPSVSYVGDNSTDDQRVFNIQVSNHRDRSITILGGTATCPCMATNDLPITVPAKESRTIAVQINFPRRPGRFNRSFLLYTDDKSQPTVTAWFAGRVIAAPSP